MGHSRVVDNRGIQRIGQGEVTERASVERMDRSHASGDIAPADEQNEDVVDAVAVQTLWSGPTHLVGARLNAELMYLDTPG